MLNHKLPFKLGCDPEFHLITDKKTRISSSMAQDISRYQHSGRYGNIGQDGGMIEMRPSPADNIKSLGENVRGILKQTYSKLGLFNWITTSEHGCAGGHIHMELPSEMYQLYSSGSPKWHEFCRNLFSFYLPVYLTESEQTLNRRSGSYGSWGDIRADRKGNAYTIEVRTPSGEWLTSPKVMAAVFAYMATVHNELLKHPENVAKHNEILIKNQNEYAHIQRVAKDNVEMFLTPLQKQVKKAIKTFELYSVYKDHINWLLHADKVKEEKAKHGYNIIKGWKLDEISDKVNLELLNNKRSFSSRIANFNQNYINHHLTVLNLLKWNEDTEVGTFMTELAKYMFAYNWKFKNNYFFFGLRAEIPEMIVADKRDNLYFGANMLKEEKLAGFIKHATNKIKQKHNIDNETYMVGLPYKMRTKQDFKSLIEIIYHLEESLPNDILAPPKSWESKIADLSDITPYKPKASEEEKEPITTAQRNDDVLRYGSTSSW